MSGLDDLVREIRSFPGITRKRDVAGIWDRIGGLWPGEPAHMNEDSAIIDMGGGEYLLFCADGIMARLSEGFPYFAARAAVLAAINDILAMGGMPMGLVDVMEYRDTRGRDEMIRGLNDICKQVNIPIIGGHIHPMNTRNNISVAAVGKTRRPILSSSACVGQKVCLAIDMQGERGVPAWPCWDSHRGKGAGDVQESMKVIVRTAKEGLFKALKDISNPGILGTIAILLESSRLGGDIYLDRIKAPEGFAQAEWLKTFPSYGFVLTCDGEETHILSQAFEERGIKFFEVGEVSGDDEVRIHKGDEMRILFDWKSDSITRRYQLENEAKRQGGKKANRRSE